MKRCVNCKLYSLCYNKTCFCGVGYCDQCIFILEKVDRHPSDLHFLFCCRKCCSEDHNYEGKRNYKFLSIKNRNIFDIIIDYVNWLIKFF